MSLSGEDKTIVHRNINRTVKEQAFIAWLKNGRLTEDSGVQAQLPNPASAMMFAMPLSSRRGGIPPTTPSSVVYIGDQGTEMADNDLLLLKTRVNKGLVSFQEDDIEFLYPNWEVPTNIIEDLRSKKSNGKLFIISDEKGNLRCRVESSIKDNCLLL